MAEVTETAPPPQERPAQGPVPGETAPDTQAPPTAPDNALAATVEQMRAQIEALTGKLEQTEADKAAAAEAAEAERKAKLSASEAMAEKVAALEAQLADTQAQALAAERARALGKLGVLDKFAAYAPSADPRTADGLATLERWAADNPELRKPAGSPSSATPDALPPSLAEKAAKGNPFLRGLRGAMAEARGVALTGKGVR